MKLFKTRTSNILYNRRSIILPKQIEKFKEEAHFCKIKGGKIFTIYTTFQIANIGAESMIKNNFSISNAIKEAENKSKQLVKRL